MRPLATKRNAALAGIWIVLGAAATDGIETAAGVDLSHGVAFYIWIIPFFLVPVGAFVVGADFYKEFRLAWRQRKPTQEYLAQLYNVFTRMLCWFVAAGAAGFTYSKWIS